MSVKIAIDSTCDLSAEMIASNGITVTPLYTVLGDKALRDGVDVTPDDIYDYVSKNNVLPKTSACSVDDYLTVYKSLTADGSEVIQFNISSEMSSSHQNAVIASKEVEGVYVVDSRNLSTGSGLLVMDAVDIRDSGIPAAEIAERVRKNASLVRASFVVDTLEYLRMGGRCSAVTMLGANLLKIRPRIEVRDGAMGVYGKYRGQYDKVLLKYAEEMLSMPNINKRRAFITHTKCDDATVKSVVDEVKRLGGFEEVYDTDAGCVVTSHCGPNTLGVLFEVNE